MSSEKKTLQSLRTERALLQCALGLAPRHISRIETGRLLPGPNALRKITAALTAADPAHPVSPVQVMAACRESHRRALVARALVARAGRGRTRPAKSGRAGDVVGRASRSCPQLGKGGDA